MNYKDSITTYSSTDQKAITAGYQGQIHYTNKCILPSFVVILKQIVFILSPKKGLSTCLSAIRQVKK